jgi:hypothetical protein
MSLLTCAEIDGDPSSPAASASSVVMPLHTLGVKIPGGGRLGVTTGDWISLVTTVLYFWQPFIDHQAVMQFIIDWGFFGSIAACSMFGTFVSHKLFEWGGMAFYAALYALEGSPIPGVSAISSAKIDPSAPWAWSDPDKKVGQKYETLQQKSIWYILKYHACVCIVQFLIFTTAIQYSWSDRSFHWEWITGHPELKRADPATIPSKATVAYQCLVSTFVAETGQWSFRHRGCTL